MSYYFVRCGTTTLKYLLMHCRRCRDWKPNFFCTFSKLRQQLEWHRESVRIGNYDKNIVSWQHFCWLVM